MSDEDCGARNIYHSRVRCERPKGHDEPHAVKDHTLMWEDVSFPINYRKSAEQQARELLARLEHPNADSLSAGDLVELANLINFREGVSVLTSCSSPDGSAELGQIEMLKEKHEECRSLFVKYIVLILEEEGITYIEDYGYDDKFSLEEMELFRELAAEARASRETE